MIHPNALFIFSKKRINRPKHYLQLTHFLSQTLILMKKIIFENYWDLIYIISYTSRISNSKNISVRARLNSSFVISLVLKYREMFLFGDKGGQPFWEECHYLKKKTYACHFQFFLDTKKYKKGAHFIFL